MEPNFIKTLGLEVRKHRKQAGLTQKALADHAGVGKTVIYDIEHAKQTIKLKTIIQILDVLNIDLVLSSPLIQSESEDNHAPS